MLVIVKQTCTSTQIEMAGAKGKWYTAAMSSDVSGDKGSDLGYVIVTMENGDKPYVRVNSGTSMVATMGRQ